MLTCAGQAHVTGAEGRNDRGVGVRGRRTGRAGSEGGKWLQAGGSTCSARVPSTRARSNFVIYGVVTRFFPLLPASSMSATQRASAPATRLLHRSARTQMLDVHAPASSSTAESTCGRTPFGSSATSSSSLLQTSAQSKTTHTRLSRRARSRGLCQCSESESAGSCTGRGLAASGPSSGLACHRSCLPWQRMCNKGTRSEHPGGVSHAPIAVDVSGPPEMWRGKRWDADLRKAIVSVCLHGLQIDQVARLTREIVRCEAPVRAPRSVQSRA